MDITNILNNLYDLVNIIENYKRLENKTYMLELEKSKYKAYFYGKSDLAKKLSKQIEENEDNLIGAYDGFWSSSKRANAIFRTLEDMQEQNIISKEEYIFCKEF